MHNCTDNELGQDTNIALNTSQIFTNIAITHDIISIWWIGLHDNTLHTNSYVHPDAVSFDSVEFDLSSAQCSQFALVHCYVLLVYTSPRNMQRCVQCARRQVVQRNCISGLSVQVITWIFVCVFVYIRTGLIHLNGYLFRVGAGFVRVLGVEKIDMYTIVHHKLCLSLGANTNIGIFDMSFYVYALRMDYVMADCV